MIDYNSTAYLSVEKFRSSERYLKMPEKPGIPYKCKFANQGKTTPSTGTTAMGYCGRFIVLVCFFAQAYLKPLLAKLIG